jgi:hypothetical protein
MNLFIVTSRFFVEKRDSLHAGDVLLALRCFPERAPVIAGQETSGSMDEHQPVRDNAAGAQVIGYIGLFSSQRY